MDDKEEAEGGLKRTHKRGRVAGVASCVFAVLAGCTLFLRWLFIFVAVLLAIASLGAAAQPPKRKGWFLWGTLGVFLAAAAGTYSTFLDYPSVLRTTISPVSCVQMPLPEILQDLCRRVHERGRYISFAVHEADLKVEKVTFRITDATTLREALRRLRRSAACSFRYRRCGTCGAIVPWITVFREHRAPRAGEEILLISHDRMRECEGPMAGELSGSRGAREERAHTQPP